MREQVKEPIMLPENLREKGKREREEDRKIS